MIWSIDKTLLHFHLMYLRNFFAFKFFFMNNTVGLCKHAQFDGLINNLFHFVFFSHLFCRCLFMRKIEKKIDKYSNLHTSKRKTDDDTSTTSHSSSSSSCSRNFVSNFQIDFFFFFITPLCSTWKQFSVFESPCDKMYQYIESIWLRSPNINVKISINIYRVKFHVFILKIHLKWSSSLSYTN